MKKKPPFSPQIPQKRAFGRTQQGTRFALLELVILAWLQILSFSATLQLAPQERLATLQEGDELHVSVLTSLLSTKYGSRQFSAGGPIASPAQAWLIVPDATDLAETSSHLEKAYDGLDWQHLHINDEGRLSIRQAATAIVNAEIETPLVFKMSAGSMGADIFMIERNESNEIILTTSDSKEMRSSGVLTKFRFIQSLGLGAEAVSHRPGESLIQINLTDLDQKRTQEVLVAMMRYHLIAAENILDIGVLETKAELVKVGGQAYETRHRFLASLDGSSFMFVKEQDANAIDDEFASPLEKGSFGRVGNSAYFSNLSNHPGSHRLPFPHWYNPLFTEFSIPAHRQEAFADQIDQLVAAHWSYLLQRFHESGIRSGHVLEVEVDLLWQPPVPGEEFPTPILSEISGIPTDFLPSTRHEPIRIQQASCISELRVAQAHLKPD